MSKQAFEKFIKKEKGSKKKEAFRQEKRKIKAEIRAGIEEKKKNRQQSPVYKTQNRGNNAQNTQGSADKIKHKSKRPGGGSQFQNKAATAPMPLNKFIAHAGLCARREAAEIVKAGEVTVNGNRISEPGFKVLSTDKVTVKGKQVFIQQNLVYILLNKPKDYITTADDPQNRKTVVELVRHATNERIYPVGRLDRNTTGVLLLTNDGELAQKLTHPSYEVKKIYEVKLDKPLAKRDFAAILEGIELEDGLTKADALAYSDIKDKSIIGIEIHSGHNRVVRRMFEHLGYDVKNLDRVMFANLTKKNVDRGKWRFLNEKELRLLKYMNQSFIRKKTGK